MTAKTNLVKLRILHVLKSSMFSGAENVIISIIKHLSCQFDFVYVSSDGPIRSVLEKEGIPSCLLESFDLKHIQTVIRKYDPDIVHAHDFSASLFCAAVKKDRFRLISHLHYDPYWVRGWNIKSLAYTLCCRKIDMLLTVSNKMMCDTVFTRSYSDRKRNVGNPIDGLHIRMMAAKISGECPQACDMIFVGRLEKQKNPERFIHLVYKLKARGWNSIKAVILGDGHLKDNCLKLVAKLGLEKNIRLEGFRENPYPYISSAGMLCVTSRYEGFCLVAAEATILGIPVVITATSGSVEMFGEDAPEICHSDEDFIRKVERLHTDECEYEAWRLRSGMRAEYLDNIEKYMESMSEIYKDMASASSEKIYRRNERADRT